MGREFQLVNQDGTEFQRGQMGVMVSCRPASTEKPANSAPRRRRPGREVVEMSEAIGALLEQTAAAAVDRRAVHIVGEPTLTYAELARESRAFAAALKRDFPAARHVALMMPNISR